MSAERLEGSSRDGDSERETRLAKLFSRYLERHAAGEELDLEELCAQEPELASELRAMHCHWSMLQRVGLTPAVRLSERIQSVHGSQADATVALEPEPPRDEGASAGILERLAGRQGAFGRYRLKGEVARGGMGAILRVWDEDLRRTLAMKVVLGRGGSQSEGATPAVDARTLSRFLEEAQVTGQLDHPGIVPVHELGLDASGRVYFTMKLVKGRSLAEVFGELERGEGEWTKTRVLGALQRVCEAMAYAHDKGVIHRDLKPANVMVGRFGEVYVMDFGLARVLGREDRKDVRIRPEPVSASEVVTERRERAGSDPASPLYTMDGDVVGTPAYMPLEQAAGKIEEIGPHSDVYALGAMLYHLLSGEMPYVPRGARLNHYAVWARVQEGPPRPLSELAPDAPAELVAICEKAMARDWRRRYRDMGELADELRAFLEHRVVRAYRTGAVAELVKWVERNKGLAAASAAAVLLLVVGLAVSSILWARSEENRQVAERKEGEARVSAESEKLARVEAQQQKGLAEESAEEARLAEREARRQQGLAEESEGRARESEARALKEREDVLSLSAGRRLDELIERAKELWPAHPERIGVLEAWIEDARELIEGSERVRGLEEHREKLAELQRRALEPSEEERERALGEHAELGRLERGVVWTRRMLAIREGGADPLEAEPLELGEVPEDAQALNALAGPLVDPAREEYGREREGLELAGRAAALAPEDAAIADTLAWALFANGLDEEALAESERAIAAAPQEREEAFASRLERLRALVEERAGEEGLSRLRAGVAGLEAELARREAEALPPRFASEEDDWWHGELSGLVARLEAFADEEAGLLSSGISAEHGWGVERRLAEAANLGDVTLEGAEARRRWEEACASIADRDACPQYGGLELAPQLGLLPIGRDRESLLWEFWHVQSGAEPKRDAATGKLVLAEESGLVLVLIPGGSFWMGAQSTDPSAENYDPRAQSNESPVREVALDPFLLSKYELTQGQWLRFAGRNPSSYKPKSNRVASLVHPVENVSWEDCDELARRLGLVLPTEAQWEYAARAGTGTPWWTGAEPESLAGAANLADRTWRAGGGQGESEDWLEDGYVVHGPVGALRPNAFGLHDVYGNILEWCRDWYCFDAHELRAGDGERVIPHSSSSRVSRGGGWNASARDARSADRDGCGPGGRGGILGFRPARVITD